MSCCVLLQRLIHLCLRLRVNSCWVRLERVTDLVLCYHLVGNLHSNRATGCFRLHVLRDIRRGVLSRPWQACLLPMSRYRFCMYPHRRVRDSDCQVDLVAKHRCAVSDTRSAWVRRPSRTIETYARRTTRELLSPIGRPNISRYPRRTGQTCSCCRHRFLSQVSEKVNQAFDVRVELNHLTTKNIKPTAKVEKKC